MSAGQTYGFSLAPSLPGRKLPKQMMTNMISQGFKRLVNRVHRTEFTGRSPLIQAGRQSRPSHAQHRSSRPL